jgi:hypothetical protein
MGQALPPQGPQGCFAQLFPKPFHDLDNRLATFSILTVFIYERFLCTTNLQILVVLRRIHSKTRIGNGFHGSFLLVNPTDLRWIPVFTGNDGSLIRQSS